MSIYNQLIANFERNIKGKTNHGSKAAISIFRLVFRDTVAHHGPIPNGKELHDLFIDRVEQKNGWGYKQLISLLDELVMEVTL